MAAHPDGTLLKASGPEIDMMSGGVRRWIPDPTTFTDMGLNWSNVVTIADSEWSAIPSGPPYPSRTDGTLLQGSGPQIYVMQNAQRHWIPDPATFTASGYQWSAVNHIADADLTAIPLGVAVAESALAALSTASAQVSATLSQLGSQPASVQDMIALQASLAQYNTAVTTTTSVMADYANTLKSIVQKIG